MNLTDIFQSIVGALDSVFSWFSNNEPKVKQVMTTVDAIAARLKDSHGIELSGQDKAAIGKDILAGVVLVGEGILTQNWAPAATAAFTLLKDAADRGATPSVGVDFPPYPDSV